MTKAERIKIIGKLMKRASDRLSEISEHAAKNFGNAINAYASEYFKTQRFLNLLKGILSVLESCDNSTVDEILTGMINSEISYVTSEIFSVRTDPRGQLESKGYVQLVSKGGELETLKEFLKLN